MSDGGVLASSISRASQLAQIFRQSYVCIRRYRATDGRLLPLVLDPPRLLKNKADPSALALQVGLARALPPPTAAADDPSGGGAPTSAADAAVADAAVAGRISAACTADALAAGGAPVPNAFTEPAPVENMLVDTFVGSQTTVAAEGGTSMAVDDVTGVAGVDTSTATDDDVEYAAALARGLRLFSLYVAAGGAVCMRHVVWRRLMPVIHPDKGGDTRVFQLLSDLKRRIDQGETVNMPRAVGGAGRTPPPPSPNAAERVGDVDACAPADDHDDDDGRVTEALYARVRAELEAAAQGAGASAMLQIRQLLDE